MGMEKFKKYIKELFESGEIEGFLGIRKNGLHPVPHLFTPEHPEELETLTIPDVRYPMTEILLTIVRKYPDKKLGIMVRGCDERALNELVKNQKILPELIKHIGIACSADLAASCRCAQPYPEEIHYGEKVAPVEDRSDIEAIDTMPQEERFDYWMSEFSKCIKCYGCRNICSMCFCDQCTLEDNDLIATGQAPPAIPIFHLIRAFHMAGRCIDCGLCEEACPAHIPLRTLYRKVRESMSGFLGYVSGTEGGEKDPLEFLGSEGYMVPSKIDEK